MGRLTLNVLLSFAQFEREVTGERIRDKVAASKRKGMWMGGPVPIGYRLEGRRLIVDEAEAVSVRAFFERYVELRSISALVEEMDRRGVRSKLRTHKDGRVVGGIAFTKGPLAQLLKNPIYLGKVRHGGELHPGQHDAIIDQPLWDKVEAVFQANGRDRKLGRKLLAPSLLVGILSDPEGRPMTPVHTTKHGKRYRYYVSRLPAGGDRNALWRVPAGELDRLAVDLVRNWLATEHPIDEGETAEAIQRVLMDRRGIAHKLPVMTKPEQREVLLALGARVAMQPDGIDLAVGVCPTDAGEPLRLRAATNLIRKGSELRFAVPPDGIALADPDPVLLKLVAQAHAVETMLVAGKDSPTVAHYGKRHLWQLLRINWLAPDILTAIVNGAQPVTLTGRHLLRATEIPLDWAEQRKMFGFA